MSYEQFLQEIEERLQGRIREDQSVQLHTALKNNGTTRKGITLVTDGATVLPTVYLEECYAAFMEGGDLDAVVDEILRVYGNVRMENPWEERDIKDLDSLKGHIVFRVVNREANRELLRDVPHLEVLDLAIIFPILVELEEAEGSMATLLIRNAHFRYWDITVEELFQIALKNAQELLPAEAASMIAAVENMISEDERSRFAEEEDYMYILTNKQRNFGAGVILYPDLLRNMGAYLKENFYVLPSSVHEVIVLPQSKAVGKENLSAIVYEINHTQVAREDILSDRAYYYDISKGELLM